MPSNQSPLGALPARFRRARLLIVGCGDVGLRVLRERSGAARAPRPLALTSSPERVAALRAAGALPLVGDLDQPATLARLAGLAHQVLYLAPPPSGATAAPWLDPRSMALAHALRRRTLPQVLVYASTSGVYGDCQGAWMDETRPVRPATARAQRRVNAERVWRHLGRAGVRVSILRVPGIYAHDRVGGTPRERLLRGAPVLRPEEDVQTNHIQADDLARACIAALWRGQPQRTYHISDVSDLAMGDYYDLAADLYGLPRPPRVTRAEAAAQLSPMQLSFMGESRRLRNARLTRELRLRLRYPTVREGLGVGLPATGQRG